MFGQVALDYCFAPELCRPRAAQQKGAVQNLVGWVKDSFFKCRRFHDRADLEAQLAQWLTVVNAERPSRATGEIPAVRLAQERQRLRPLPIAAAAYALKIPAVVPARARVAYERSRSQGRYQQARAGGSGLAAQPEPSRCEQVDPASGMR